MCDPQPPAQPEDFDPSTYGYEITLPETAAAAAAAAAPGGPPEAGGTPAIKTCNNSSFLTRVEGAATQTSTWSVNEATCRCGERVCNTPTEACFIVAETEESQGAEGKGHCIPYDEFQECTHTISVSATGMIAEPSPFDVVMSFCKCGGNDAGAAQGNNFPPVICPPMFSCLPASPTSPYYPQHMCVLAQKSYQSYESALSKFAENKAQRKMAKADAAALLLPGLEPAPAVVAGGGGEGADSLVLLEENETAMVISKTHARGIGSWIRTATGVVLRMALPTGTLAGFGAGVVAIAGGMVTISAAAPVAIPLLLGSLGALYGANWNLQYVHERWHTVHVSPEPPVRAWSEQQRDDSEFTSLGQPGTAPRLEGGGGSF